MPPNSRGFEQRLPQLSPNNDSSHFQLFSRHGLGRVMQEIGWEIVVADTPSYAIAWLRVITKILRRVRGLDEETVDRPGVTVRSVDQPKSWYRRICLSCFYIDGFGYQENELIRQHVSDGHDVFVIASTETFGRDGKLTYVEPSAYRGAEGAPVTRLAYRTFLPHALMKKLRMHRGVYALLCEMKPDAILFHGLCGWELHAVARYKRENAVCPAVCR